MGKRSKERLKHQKVMSDGTWGDVERDSCGSPSFTHSRGLSPEQTPWPGSSLTALEKTVLRGGWADML